MQRCCKIYNEIFSLQLQRHFHRTSILCLNEDMRPKRSVSPLSSMVINRLKSNSYERCVRPCEASMYRFYMEQHIEKLSKGDLKKRPYSFNLFQLIFPLVQQHRERRRRETQLIREMEAHSRLTDVIKTRVLEVLRQKESNYIRLRRQKMDKSMFELIRY